MEIVKAVQCTLPGFEQASITVNLMATPEQASNFVRRMGNDGSHTGVIVKVEGWDKDEFGPDPWDVKRVPGIWFAWCSQKGWALAMKGYLDDPNS